MTNAEPVLLDTDTLSELSRGNPRVCERALAYLSRFGRLTITAITVFERLRGYRLAIRNGRPYQRQMQAFQTLVASSDVLPFDESAAAVAGEIGAACLHIDDASSGTSSLRASPCHDSYRWSRGTGGTSRNSASLQGPRSIF